MNFSFPLEVDEEYNDAAFFQVEVHDDLEDPKEQLGIEMERVSLNCCIVLPCFIAFKFAI